jgi:tetratricopeptide (TPR) repeat protein
MKIYTLLKTAAALMLAAGLAFAQPKPKSQAEVDAIMAIQNATEPAARITAVENLLTKFADTEFKSFALMVAAASAQQMNDYEKMVVYAERTLEADPKNFQTMLMLASGLASRTREHDLDREEKLGRAEKLANQAIDISKTAAKPNPQITDADWEQAKKDVQAQGYEALGQIAMVRKKYDVAAQNWKTAVDTAANPDPATMVRLANAYNQMGKPDEAIAVLDKLNTMPEVHPQIKSAATEQRNNAVKLKGGGAKPATPAPAAGAPPAPAQVPITK